MTGSANDSKIPTGTILVGKYKVSREIGRGGMAAVYEAEHLALAKKVAIKVLAAELTASKIVSERFFREARAAASVKSPHIVDVYDSGRLEDGRPFIVMELLEGESLYDRMASIRLIPPKDTAKIIQDCAKGLAKAHSAGIVHRDLKPENIFILKGEDGKELCKILDFGLAKFYSPVQPGDEKTARLTREGAVFGTPAYMSPEQVKGQGNVDHRADLWALGCMAYECLTGRPVWNTEQGVAMTFAAIATEQLPVPSEVYPDLPIGFDAWFRKALERDVEKRFQNAIELADNLIIALGSPSGTSLPALRASSREVNAVNDSVPSSREQPHLDSVTQIALPPSDHSLKVLPAPTPRESPHPEGTALTPRETAKPSTLRYVVGGVAMLASFGAAGFTWMRFLGPQVSTPVVASTATPIEPTAVTSARPLPATEEFKWSKTLADAQRALTAGDSGAALRKFAEAEKLGAGSIAKGLAEQATAASKGRGTCQVRALSHPRGLEKADASRPTVLALPKGALVAWTDNHEQPSQEHVYSVLIDDAGVALSSVRDLSPEGGRVLRPVLYPADDKIALFYWDTNGKGAGVNARILDAEGHIDDKLGEAKLVASGKVNWPAYETTPTGFGVVWGDDRDGNTDLFFRKLGRDLGPDGREVRLTDYAPAKNHTTNVRIPALTIAANALLVAYRLDRDKSHAIYRMRVSLAAPELGKGLDEKTEAGRQERELGDTQVLQDDRGDSPSVACGTEGCFVAWQDEPKGARVAMIDSIRGKKVWAKTFAPNGMRPSLAVGPKGDVAIAYYEAGQVRIAPVSRDGIGAPSNFAKVNGDITRPDAMRPYLAPGKTRGEWFVGWLDEVPHGEVYVARLTCPR